MSEIQNLQGVSAAEKIKELAEKADVCLFGTDLGHTPVKVRPMSTRQVDPHGNIYFFSRKTSDKNKEIDSNSAVQLFYSNNTDYEYLNVYGKAEIFTDKALAKELWTTIAKTWFNEGYEDPELTIIRVKPVDAYYWDSKDGKLVSLLKFAAGAITGKEFETGIEGQIK